MPGFGYLPDHHDPRDVMFGSLLRASAPPPERSGALQSYATPTDQEDGEGCVGWSVANGIWTRWNYLADESNQSQPVPRPSPMWCWWLARKFEGMQDWNVGSRIRDAIKQIVLMGICSEALHPSNPPSELVNGRERFSLQPSVQAFEQAIDQRFPISYSRIGEFTDQRRFQVSQALSAGFPVVFGTQVTPAFEQLRTHAPVQPPKPGELIAGGHAMQATHYDEHGVYGPGTWGRLWGNAGWFALTWEYILSDLTQDIWTIDCALPRVWP